jgi:hypothetical protein
MTTGAFNENTVLLPGGLMLQPNQTLSRASLRPLSGRDEEWLARHRDSPSAIRVTWLLNQCLVALDGVPVSSELVQRMLVGDREFLMLQLRRITLGDNVQAVVNCPTCGNKMDVDFRLDEIPVHAQRQKQANFTLELSERTVRFRLPTGGDQEAVVHLENAVEALVDRCVEDDGGTPLSSGECEALGVEMGQLAPQVDVELDLTCPECSHSFILPFDMTAFFLDEVAVKANELLQEVHALASYYHWSESDILSLERGRRRAYLALLHEALRRD